MPPAAEPDGQAAGEPDGQAAGEPDGQAADGQPGGLLLDIGGVVHHTGVRPVGLGPS